MDSFLRHISRSLGRETVPTSVPTPPEIDESAARLVKATEDLPALFTANAERAKMHVHAATHDDLASQIAQHLTANNLRSAVVTRCPLFERIGLMPTLRSAGVDARNWDESSLDASYEVDVGITDVWWAIAETGSLIVRGSARHGRAASLVPPFHIAVVERWQIVPDLIDAMAKVQYSGTASGVVLITGPSKTADIEMNLVVGVHGPGAVELYLV